MLQVNNALAWKGLQQFGDVSDSVNWESGPAGVYYHSKCNIDIRSSRKLQQKQNKRKQSETATSPNDTEQETAEAPKRRKVTRNYQKPLHNMYLCIWCMKGNNQKRGTESELKLLSTLSSWNKFKSHTVYLEDEEMRTRMLTFIAATSDPFATEVRYHVSCWKKNIRKVYMNDDENDEEMHGVTTQEVKQQFFNHVRTRIIELNEPRTLQGLLLDYKSL